MSSERLQVCFQALRSTGELVLTGAFAADTLDEDPLRCAWAAAEADAALAYDAWQERRDGRGFAFAVYRAAADRAAAAQDALAAASLAMN